MVERPGSAAKLILVGGHESNHGKDLGHLAAALPGVRIVTAGRSLQTALSDALASATADVVVLPMTFGRNPTLVADTAKTMKWLADGGGGGRVALSESFGTPDHLIAWLRTAATKVHASGDNSALLLLAAKANPFDDAELFRIAHLVRTHGTGSEVEAACVGNDGEIAAALGRLHLLGHESVVIIPAGFAQTCTAPLGQGAFEDATFCGPLLTPQTVLRVINDRFTAALHELSHGRDGIAAGLTADHGHGYAHSHAFEEGQGHTHTHGLAHSHTH